MTSWSSEKNIERRQTQGGTCWEAPESQIQGLGEYCRRIITAYIVRLVGFHTFSRQSVLASVGTNRTRLNVCSVQQLQINLHISNKTTKLSGRSKFNFVLPNSSVKKSKEILYLLTELFSHQNVLLKYPHVCTVSPYKLQVPPPLAVPARGPDCLCH